MKKTYQFLYRLLCLALRKMNLSRPFFTFIRKIKKSIFQPVINAGKLAGKYFCPICNNRVWCFSQINDMWPENFKKNNFIYRSSLTETFNTKQYNCPVCGATDRDRLYALYLKEILPQINDFHIFNFLDIAPSVPLSVFIRREIRNKKVNYRTADLIMNNVDDNIDIMDMNIYADESFDFFICSHVLEHVRDDRKALKELLRILKPGSKGILMVPIYLSSFKVEEDPDLIDENERWHRFGQYDHIRAYSKNGFIERIISAGFSIDQLGINHFGKITFKKTGLSFTSVLYIVSKSNTLCSERQQ